SADSDTLFSLEDIQGKGTRLHRKCCHKRERPARRYRKGKELFQALPASIFPAAPRGDKMMKKTLLSAVSALAILMGGSLAMAQAEGDAAPPAPGAGGPADSESGTGRTTGDTGGGGAATAPPGTSMPDAGEEARTTAAPSDTTTPPAT